MTDVLSANELYIIPNSVVKHGTKDCCVVLGTNEAIVGNKAMSCLATRP